MSLPPTPMISTVLDVLPMENMFLLNLSKLIFKIGMLEKLYFLEGSNHNQRDFLLDLVHVINIFIQIILETNLLIRIISEARPKALELLIDQDRRTSRKNGYLAQECTKLSHNFLPNFSSEYFINTYDFYVPSIFQSFL